jgi:hypothetical protein
VVVDVAKPNGHSSVWVPVDGGLHGRVEGLEFRVLGHGTGGRPTAQGFVVEFAVIGFIV